MSLVYVSNQFVCSLFMAKLVVKWDSWVHKVWLDICVDEVGANSRPQHCLNFLGYANLMKKFTERIKRPYTHDQHKNRWDNLKRTYTRWKTLNIKASGLGRDPITGSFEASDDWWKEENKVIVIVFFCYGRSYSIF
jgi:hypothetical protein